MASMNAWILPRFSLSLRMRGRDNVGGRLFNDAEAIELQLSQDRRLPRTRRASDDEASHAPVQDYV